MGRSAGGIHASKHKRQPRLYAPHGVRGPPSITPRPPWRPSSCPDRCLPVRRHGHRQGVLRCLPNTIVQPFLHARRHIVAPCCHVGVCAVVAAIVFSCRLQLPLVNTSGGRPLIKKGCWLRQIQSRRPLRLRRDYVGTKDTADPPLFRGKQVERPSRTLVQQSLDQQMRIFSGRYTFSHWEYSILRTANHAKRRVTSYAADPLP